MVAASLLSTLLLALAVAAQPVEETASLVKLSFAKHVNTGITNLVQHDRQRADRIKAGNARGLRSREVVNSPAENRAVTYIASVGVGSPATTYDLIIDTGSSNTWIGSNKAYVKTSTSSQTPDSVSVFYGSGNFSGTEYIDQITIAPGLVIPKQSIGVANKSEGFSTVDGIIGVGPAVLTAGTLSPGNSTIIPTVTDNLFSSGTISENVLSVSFEPITDSDGIQINGELTWGGTDSSKFTGAINYVPITTTTPATDYWGVDASINYGDTTLLSTTAGIVDTGTSLVQIATEAFNSYQKATGGVPDTATGLLKIDSSQFEILKSLFFYVGGVAYELTPNAQIWPRSLNSNIGGTPGSIYLTVIDAGTKSGSGLDFLLGQTFLERFYSVYDTANKRVGLATTPFTTATTN